MTRESDSEKTDGQYQLDEQRRTLLKLAGIWIPASSAIASAGVASGQSDVQVTKKDLTGDGNDDIRIENSKVFLQLSSADISTRRLVSTAGRQGGSNLLHRGFDTRPTLRHSSHQHRPEFQSLKSFEVLEDGGNVGAYRIVREYTYHDEPIEITADIKLFADDNFFLIYLSYENIGSEPLALDQVSSNIHDGIMVFNRLGLAGRSDSDNEYRFYLAGQGTRKFTNTRKWQTFSGTTRGTFFDLQDALTYGLLDGATEPKMWIKEKAHLDFLVQEHTLDPGQSITYTNVVGLHSGGSNAPDTGTQIYNNAKDRVSGDGGNRKQVDATIIEFETHESRVTPGERVTSTVTVENTGNVGHTFFVGYSIIGPDGEEYHNDGSTGRVLTLDTQERDTIEVSWLATSDMPTGTYDAITTVWEESDRSNLQTDLDTETNNQAVTIVPDDIRAEITGFETQGGTVEPGDEVRSTVTVENTGAVDHTFFVGYSVISPEGREFNNDGETGIPVTIAAGEETEVELTWYVSHPTPPGTYHAITAVWLESDRSNLETQLAADENPEAFTVENSGFVPTVHGFGFPNWEGGSGCVIPEVQSSDCPDPQYTFTYAEYEGISRERAEAGIEQWRETPGEQTKAFLVRTIPSLVNSLVATNGHCYGMIYSAAEYFEAPTELPTDVETASEIPWPAEQYEAVGDRIRDNQRGQLLNDGAFWYALFGFWAGSVDLELSLETIKNVLDDEETVAIILGDSGKTGGHIVLAYDYIETNGQVEIFFYDPSYAAEDHHENSTRYQSKETPLRFVMDADTGQLVKNYNGYDLYIPTDDRVSHKAMIEIVGNLESNIQGLIEDTADEVASWMVFELNSPASLEIDAPDAATVAQPEADFDFSGLLSDFAYIVGIPTSDFTISVQGHGDGEYTLDAFGMRNGNIIIDETISGTITSDEEDQYAVTVGETSEETTIEPVEQTESTLPGFGIVSALAGAGGAAYLFKRFRTSDDEEDSK